MTQTPTFIERDEESMNEKMPVGHPLNCRCRKCRYDED